MLDETKQTLGAVLGNSICEFLYDFGDDWRCRIAVRFLAQPNTEWPYPLCTGGARAASPDDVGGVLGAAEFLAAIQDAENSEYDSILSWIGCAFDPEGFDLNAINRILRIGRP